MNKPHEECGLFGIYNSDDFNVAEETYLALYALQHRGQESCGIAVNDDGVFTVHKDTGLVPDVFNERTLQGLGSGRIAIGHVRYSPSNRMDRSNSQPLVMRYIKGTVALGHNGSLVNTAQIRRDLEKDGAIFQTNCDAEIILYVIARARIHAHSIEAALSQSMKTLKGAYSLVLSSPSKLIAARDPNGFRPLSIGKNGNTYMVASETCAFDSVGAKFVRDVEPGEIVIIDENGLRSIKDNCGKKSSFCIFEYVYFSRPDSVLQGLSVHMARQNAGRLLAKEHPVEADLVCGVPDSGLDAALGYSIESGIPYGIAFIKNRYVGRTFIGETQKKRERAVRIKLNALEASVKGKRVVLIDDSIVRGTTCAHIVELLREAGAKEVHMRISSPPFLNPCYFGTDISSRDHLIACRLSIDEICKQIGADTLGYLSLDGMQEMAKDAAGVDFCLACFNGEYPIDVPEEMPVDKYENKIVRGSKPGEGKG